MMDIEKDTTKQNHPETRSYRWASRRGVDRRSGVERRQLHSLYRRITDQTERRHNMERRKTDELRRNWTRISQWSSMFVGTSSINMNKSG